MLNEDINPTLLSINPVVPNMGKVAKPVKHLTLQILLNNSLNIY